MADADTENKRRSALCITGNTTMPLADGTIDDNDRMHATWYYAGIDPGAAVATATKKTLLLLGVGK